MALSISPALSNSTIPNGPFRDLFTSEYTGGATFLKWSFKSCHEVLSGSPRTHNLKPVEAGGALLLSSNLSPPRGRPRATSTRIRAPIKSRPSLPRTASSASLKNRATIHQISNTPPNRDHQKNFPTIAAALEFASDTYLQSPYSMNAKLGGRGGTLISI
jgi:hypothetical protein